LLCILELFSLDPQAATNNVVDKSIGTNRILFTEKTLLGLLILLNPEH
jgi:hypothetical protein